jgi:PAS domain-containing protein
MDKLCVLLMEDCRAEADRLRGQLEMLGHRAILAGPEDLRVQALLERVVPDLALVGASSREGGLGTADAVRERFGVPVICLADSGEASVWQAGEAGRNVLFTPVDERELEAAMEFALQQRAVESMLHRSEDAVWELAGAGACGEAIIFTDEDCGIRFMNPAAEEMTGRPWLEAAGLNADRLLRLATGNDPPAASGLRLAIRDRLDLSWGRGWVRNKAGEEIPVKGSVTVLCESRSKAIGAVVKLSRGFAGSGPGYEVVGAAPYISTMDLAGIWLRAECRCAWHRVVRAVRVLACQRPAKA